jgi:predicted enzyme related to lactoylglutathione lyase
MQSKKINIVIFIFISFTFGFTLSEMIHQSQQVEKTKKVTGIGGIFFKCKDPKALREWYEHNLGLNTNQYGAVFEFYRGGDSTQKGFLQWSPFKETTTYFGPSTKEFMINYRVADLEFLISEFKKSGVQILDSIEVYEYGKFLHILDLEGNKIELWEPNDVAFEKMGHDMSLKTTY